MIITSKIQSIIYEKPEEEDKQSSIQITKMRNKNRTKSIDLNSNHQSEQTLKNLNEGCITIDNDTHNTGNYKKDEHCPLTKAFFRTNSCKEMSPKKQFNFCLKNMPNEENDIINCSLDSDSNTIPGTMHVRNCSSNSNNELKAEEINLEINDFIGKTIKKKRHFDHSKIITFNEVWEYFSSLNINEEKRLIKVEDLSNVNFFKRILSQCLKQYELHSHLIQERERIFSIAKIPYEESNATHQRTFQSIYQYLTQDNQPDYYNWEQIGFQGEPKNDLRSVGLFGAVQIIAFIDRYPQLALGFFNFLKSIQSEWIFAILLLNITQIVLDLLRGGTLVSYCNKRGRVLDTLNSFYFGVIYHVSKELVSQNKHWLLNKSMITDQYISHLISEIRDFSEKNPAHFFWNCQQLNELYPLQLIIVTSNSSFTEKQSSTKK